MDAPLPAAVTPGAIDPRPAVPAGPPIVASAGGPVADESRLLALDACRAIALLGIFFVNAHFFGEPFADAIDMRVPEGESGLGLFFYFFDMIFCAGKFYPLFSLLFGVGLAIMFLNARRAGRSFEWRFLRRITMLAVFGLLHIALLWAGDVLLIYALTGLWMLILGRCSARVLLTVGACVFTFGLLLSTGFAFLGTLGGAQPPFMITDPRPMPEGATALEQYFKVLQAWDERAQMDPRLGELQEKIYREGPLLHAMAVRAFDYAFMMIYVVVHMFWHVLSLFCLGAALLKTGFFHGALPRVRRALIGLGLLVGLPLSVVSLYAAQHPTEGWAAVVAQSALYVGGPLMSLMYLSLVVSWVQSGKVMGAARFLANLGRMGLTGYILESVLMSFVMLHWGLARFGTTTWAERGVMLVCMWLGILVFANIWMRFFRFGPLEWVWRTVTYLKPQPMRR